MRQRYLIAYDITDSKRLHRIHKMVQSYAIGGQKSFYECWLTPTEFAELQAKLTACFSDSEDRIIIFKLSADTRPQLFGTAHLQSTQPFLIV